ncbi:MAG: hypothetical protein ACYC0V_05270 [Armatimonadota bacterium]
MNHTTNQNYEIIGFTMVLVIFAIPVVLLILAFLDWIRCRITKAPRRRWLYLAAIIANVIFAACMIDAFLVEPGLLTTTRISLSKPAHTCPK